MDIEQDIVRRRSSRVVLNKAKKIRGRRIQEEQRPQGFFFFSGIEGGALPNQILQEFLQDGQISIIQTHGQQNILLNMGDDLIENPQQQQQQQQINIAQIQNFDETSYFDQNVADQFQVFGFQPTNFFFRKDNDEFEQDCIDAFRHVNNKCMEVRDYIFITDGLAFSQNEQSIQQFQVMIGDVIRLVNMLCEKWMFKDNLNIVLNNHPVEEFKMEYNTNGPDSMRFHNQTFMDRFNEQNIQQINDQQRLNNALLLTDGDGDLQNNNNALIQLIINYFVQPAHTWYQQIEKIENLLQSSERVGDRSERLFTLMLFGQFKDGLRGQNVWNNDNINQSRNVFNSILEKTNLEDVIKYQIILKCVLIRALDLDNDGFNFMNNNARLLLKYIFGGAQMNCRYARYNNNNGLFIQDLQNNGYIFSFFRSYNIMVKYRNQKMIYQRQNDIENDPLHNPLNLFQWYHNGQNLQSQILTDFFRISQRTVISDDIILQNGAIDLQPNAVDHTLINLQFIEKITSNVFKSIQPIARFRQNPNNIFMVTDFQGCQLMLFFTLIRSDNNQLMMSQGGNPLRYTIYIKLDHIIIRQIMQTKVDLYDGDEQMDMGNINLLQQNEFLDRQNHFNDQQNQEIQLRNLIQVGINNWILNLRNNIQDGEDHYGSDQFIVDARNVYAVPADLDDVNIKFVLNQFSVQYIQKFDEGLVDGVLEREDFQQGRRFIYQNVDHDIDVIYQRYNVYNYSIVFKDLYDNDYLKFHNDMYFKKNERNCYMILVYYLVQHYGFNIDIVKIQQMGFQKMMWYFINKQNIFTDMNKQISFQVYDQNILQIRSFQCQNNTESKFIIAVMDNHCFIANNLKILQKMKEVKEYRKNNVRKQQQEEKNVKLKKDKKIQLEFIGKPLKGRLEVQKKKISIAQEKSLHIFFDLETTTGLKIETLIICYKCIDGESLRNVNIGDNDFTTDCKVIKYEIDQIDSVGEQFILTLKSIYEKFQKDYQKFYIGGWNSNRFDTILLLKYIFNQFAISDIEFIGTFSVVKIMNIFQGKLIFIDYMLNTSGKMSLNNFCKSFNPERQKMDDQEIKEFMLQCKTVEDWNNFEFKQKIIEYCKQDVDIMIEAVIKYNKVFNDILIDLCDKTNNKKCDTFEINKIFTVKSLPGLSFKILDEILINKHEVFTINQKKVGDLYKWCRKSYRGGVTQVFTQNQFVKNDQNELEYIDANSLYPFVMAKCGFTSELGTTKHEGQVLQIFDYNLYIINSFYLPQDIFQFGFIPVKPNNSAQLIFPTAFEANDETEYISLWGFEMNAIINNIKMFKGEDQLIDLNDLFGIKFYYQPTGQIGQNYFQNIGFIYDERKKCQKTNPQKAQILKLMMNSSYGQLGMRDFELEMIIDQQLYHDMNMFDGLQNHIQKWLQKQNDKLKLGDNIDISRIQEFNEFRIVKIFFKYNEKHYIPFNKKPKLVHVASQITARARCYLFNSMYKLKFNKIDVIYCDTDSIIYQNNNLELNVSDILGGFDDVRLGAFKREIDQGKIKLVQCFAPKLYKIQFEDKDGELKDLNKCKGVSFKDLSDEDIEDIYQKMQDVIDQKNFGKKIIVDKQNAFYRSSGNIDIKQISKQIQLKHIKYRGDNQQLKARDEFELVNNIQNIDYLQ